MKGGGGDGRGVQMCWANIRCWGVLLISIVGQGSIVPAINADGGCVWIFFLSSIFSLFILPLCQTAGYRLK